MNLIDYFWPELFQMGFVSIFRTPLIVVTLKNKDIIEFFTEREFRAWEQSDGKKEKGWNFKYYKGLGTWDTNSMKRFIGNLDRYLFTVALDGKEDEDAIDLAFNSQRADNRKTWLETPAEDFEKFII
jgi:DNA topoisomerase-2